MPQENPANPHFIPVTAPFAWPQILRYLRPRSTPGIETVEEDRWLRSTPRGQVSVSYADGAIRCAAHADDARMRRLFDTDCDIGEVARVLRRSPILRARMRKTPGVRVPGCWEPFELCLRVILGQQVSVAAAHTLMRRMVERSGGAAPDQVAAADLRSIGLTGSRARTIRTLAGYVAEGRIRFEGAPWEELADGLRAIPGFGPWTLDYLALRLGRDPDAFPATDLGLLRASGAASPADLRRQAEPWRPFRGYAAMYFWMG